MLVVGSNFPPWWPFLIESYKINHPSYELIVVHTRERQQTSKGEEHVRYVHIAVDELKQRFIDKIGATRAQVDAKFASGKGLSDLKPLYGRVFDDLIATSRYSHWGWVDWDLILGDLRAVIPEQMLWSYDALTFPGATLGFAWAGQLSIFRNTDEARTLFSVVPRHVELAFKTGTGEARQSGWEERIFLRETLRHRPQMSILFHMSAQFDYKAQWLTWVPFDHFWDRGKVWRCAKVPLFRPGRPTLLVANRTRWLADVQQIQTDPHGFEARKDGRVCIRWDLESSPWRCCPHATGVSYSWRGERLLANELPYTNGSASLRIHLAAASKSAAVRPREAAYDICQEGGFFHAGLTPRGGKGNAPSCTDGTWALQDDIGRFSGSLTLLQEQC